MPYHTREGSIIAMDTISINLALPRRQQMPDALMHSIEKPLSVKRAAFEYDGYLMH
jgi:hypothetical protein